VRSFLFTGRLAERKNVWFIDCVAFKRVIVGGLVLCHVRPPTRPWRALDLRVLCSILIGAA